MLKTYRWFQYGGVRPANGTGLAFYETGLPIRLDSVSAPFYMYGLEVYNLGYNPSIRCRDEKQQYFQSDMVPTVMINDDNKPMPIIPAKRYPANGVFSYDLSAPQTEGFGDIWTILHGYHELDQTVMPDPGYPDKFEPTPYTHRVRVEVPATANHKQRVPIRLPFDVPFAIRKLDCTKVSGDGADVRVQLLDANGMAFSNRALPMAVVFALENPQIARTPGPELLVPAGKSYILDVVQAASPPDATTIDFLFTGALLDAVA